MTDSTPNEDDAAVPAEGAAAETAGTLAERAKRMLDHGDDAVKQPIMDAATGAGDESAVVRAATTATPSGAPGTSGAEGAGIGPLGGGGGRRWSSGDGPGGDDDEGFFPELPLSGTNQVIVLGLLTTAFLLFGTAIWSFIPW